MARIKRIRKLPLIGGGPTRNPGPGAIIPPFIRDPGLGGILPDEDEVVPPFERNQGPGDLLPDPFEGEGVDPTEATSTGALRLGRGGIAATRRIKSGKRKLRRPGVG